MEKKMEARKIKGYIGTAIRINFFIPSSPKVSKIKFSCEKLLRELGRLFRTNKV